MLPTTPPSRLSSRPLTRQCCAVPSSATRRPCRLFRVAAFRLSCRVSMLPSVLSNTPVSAKRLSPASTWDQTAP
ncbi:hypothetical protein [Photorhabdus hindustanensis]|uniref:hypothetical protein n=1 Tax=Photorhabdus hindustanensis TaxID=2918802 RepID=UPI0030DD39AF